MGKRKDPFESGAEEDLFGEDGADPSADEPEIDGDDAPEAPEVGDEIEVEEKPASRKERRRSRIVDIAAQEAERRMEAMLDARLSKLEGFIQGAGGRRGETVDDAPAPRGDGPTIEQVNAALKQRYDMQDQLEEAWSAEIKAGTLTDEKRKDYKARARKITEEQTELQTARAAIAMGLNRRGVDPAEMQQEAIRAQSQARHADIFAHKNKQALVMYAQGYYAQQQALGKADSQDLQDEAMDAAREKFGLQPKFRSSSDRPAPTRHQRSQLSGASSGGGGRGGDNSERTTVKVTRELRAMADAAFPHIKDPTERIKHYARLNKAKGTKL